MVDSNSFEAFLSATSHDLSKAQHEGLACCSWKEKLSDKVFWHSRLGEAVPIRYRIIIAVKLQLEKTPFGISLCTD